MNFRIANIILIFLLLVFVPVKGSHIVGGEATYKFMGTDYISGYLFYKYDVSITIYEDCQNGQPTAIQADNPAFFAAYDSMGNVVNIDTAVYDTTSILVPANFSNLCITNPPIVCLLKKTFIKHYLFLPSPYGYFIAYQRCCRNAAIVNVFDPADIGATYFCRIPPTGIAVTNNSAIFKNFPPQIICINNPLIYDHSATDADGDSLTYEFCPSLKGANSFDIKPIPSAPTYNNPPYYDTVNYIYPYSSIHPMTGSPQIQINPTTGLITGTPNRIGRFLVTVCCHEWRHHILINTVTREFQFVVTNCSKSVIADIPQYSNDLNTYIVDCKDKTVHFTNTSVGGSSYHWDFGLPIIFGDTSLAFEPTFTYPDTGTYIVRLSVNPNSTCSDSIWRYVKIYPYFISNFIDSGSQCPGSPLKFKDRTVSTYKQVNNWSWSFGDGHYASLQNPTHVYSIGGTYNVMLSSENDNNCIDTAVQQVVIENFVPFVGNDTTIVKGEKVQFFGTGGIIFNWSPPYYLNDTNISNPIGFYPDTGTFTYNIRVASAFGCIGEDTIKVHVVNTATFYMPNAFSPNGDGKNDFFRPIAIGYSNLNYFKIFNRWGQLVYFGKNFETGWDGTFGGEKSDMGTYFWEISYIDRYGNQGALKGDVTLVR